MEKFKISQLHNVKVYDSKDYIEFNKDVNDSFMNILSSHEYNNASYDINKAREYVEDLNYKMFLDNLDTRIYVMYRQDQPVTFAIYNRVENTNDWHLELIYTHDEYTKLGLASALLRFSAGDLLSRYDAENITTVVAKNNFASMNLHESFSKVNGVKAYVEDADSRYGFTFDIRNMQAGKVKEETNEMLF